MPAPVLYALLVAAAAAVAPVGASGVSPWGLASPIDPGCSAGSPCSDLFFCTSGYCGIGGNHTCYSGNCPCGGDADCANTWYTSTATGKCCSVGQCYPQGQTCPLTWGQIFGIIAGCIGFLILACVIGCCFCCECCPVATHRASKIRATQVQMMALQSPPPQQQQAQPQYAYATGPGGGQPAPLPMSAFASPLQPALLQQHYQPWQQGQGQPMPMQQWPTMQPGQPLPMQQGQHMPMQQGQPMPMQQWAPMQPGQGQPMPMQQGLPNAVYNPLQGAGVQAPPM
jgi:hypothetical protein